MTVPAAVPGADGERQRCVCPFTEGFPVPASEDLLVEGRAGPVLSLLFSCHDQWLLTAGSTSGDLRLNFAWSVCSGTQG